MDARKMVSNLFQFDPDGTPAVPVFERSLVADYHAAYNRFVNLHGLVPNAFLIAPDRHAELLDYARDRSLVVKWFAAGRIPQAERITTTIMGCVIFVLPGLLVGTIRAALVDE